MLRYFQISLWITTAVLLSSTLAFGQRLKDPKVPKKKSSVRMYSNPKFKESEIDWKSTRLEFMAGGGASGFLGDLGGQNTPGKPFVFDYEPTMTRYSVSAGVRYFLREYQAVRGYLSYAEVRGADKLTSYPNRQYRNLNFKSPIVELAAIYELHLFKPTYIHFAGANTTKLFDGNRFGAYLSGGAGLFYYSPRGKLGTQYYKLRPLRTEGQEFEDGPSKYLGIAVSLPVGGGVYMLLNHNITAGLDFGMRFTTSDYVDDASGYYYDIDAIQARDGKLAAYFANPSVALQNVPDRKWYTEGQPRGGSTSNDTYMFFQFTLSKSFTPSISNKAFKPSKKRKMKAIPNKNKRSLFKRDKNKNKSYSNKGIKKSKRRFKAPKLDFGKKRKRRKATSF
ncbi:MAG: hypothetical protein RLP15_05710 [Cryomorphaceae bacterium]